MPRYFFDFRDDGSFVTDETGCEFATLDLAYLDAFRSMVRIGADQLLDQQDPSSQSIDIRDEGGAVLMVLPFDDVFRRRMKRPRPMGDIGIEVQLERSRRLRQDIRDVCESVKTSLATARGMIERAYDVEPVMARRGS